MLIDYPISVVVLQNGPKIIYLFGDCHGLNLPWESPNIKLSDILQNTFSIHNDAFFLFESKPEFMDVPPEKLRSTSYITTVRNLLHKDHKDKLIPVDIRNHKKRIVKDKDYLEEIKTKLGIEFEPLDDGEILLSIFDEIYSEICKLDPSTLSYENLYEFDMVPMDLYTLSNISSKKRKMVHEPEDIQSPKKKEKKNCIRTKMVYYGGNDHVNKLKKYLQHLGWTILYEYFSKKDEKNKFAECEIQTIDLPDKFFNDGKLVFDSLFKTKKSKSKSKKSKSKSKK